MRDPVLRAQDKQDDQGHCIFLGLFGSKRQCPVVGNSEIAHSHPVYDCVAFLGFFETLHSFEQLAQWRVIVDGCGGVASGNFVRRELDSMQTLCRGVACIAESPFHSHGFE